MRPRSIPVSIRKFAKSLQLKCDVVYAAFVSASEAPPPKYSSVFKHVKAARLQSTNKKQFAKNVMTKVGLTTCITSGMLTDK